MTKLDETLKLAAGSYSENRYLSWKKVAQLLLNRGLSPIQAATVMKSKWTRWAADYYEPSYGNCAANAIIKFMDDPRNKCSIEEIDQMVEETFPTEK